MRLVLLPWVEGDLRSPLSLNLTKLSVDEAHLIAVSLGDPSDDVLHVGDGHADGGHGAASVEPGVNLELVVGLLQPEVKVEVLEPAR